MTSSGDLDRDVKRRKILQVGDDPALRRLEQAGAVITSTSQVVSELAMDWTTPRGQALSKLLNLGV